MTLRYGRMDEVEAAVRLESIFHGQRTDWIKDGTADMRNQWHNLKYYTWVEQQGKTVEELDAQRDPEWWLGEQALVPKIDEMIRQMRELG
jgi:cysteine synthase